LPAVTDRSIDLARARCVGVQLLPPMASSMDLLGRSFLPAAAAGRDRGGGLCSGAAGTLAVWRQQGRSRGRSLRSTALAERVVLTPAPTERSSSTPPEPGHPQSVAARAVVTVRRRRKEDAKQRVVEQLDAYADRLGRSVLLELVSVDTDSSKDPLFP
jgi:lipoxygenase